MNDGSQDTLRSRLTTTWKEPLAASYLLSVLIDLSTTGELRSMVVSANGFLSWGSRCTVERTRRTAINAAAMPTINPSARTSRPRLGGRAASWSSLSRGSILMVGSIPDLRSGWRGMAGAMCVARYRQRPHRNMVATAPVRRRQEWTRCRSGGRLRYCGHVRHRPPLSAPAPGRPVRAMDGAPVRPVPDLARPARAERAPGYQLRRPAGLGSHRSAESRGRPA